MSRTTIVKSKPEAVKAEAVKTGNKSLSEPALVKGDTHKNGDSTDDDDDDDELTTEILKEIVNTAFTNAAANAMTVMGYNVIAEDGWVVKIFADGTREKITELKVVPRPANIILY